jgi:hypothetical protein
MKKAFAWNPVGYKGCNKLDVSKLLNVITNPQDGGGAGVVIIVKRKGTMCVVLGKERGGAYKGMYNIQCGKHETGGCPIDTMQAEGYEEFGSAAGIEKVSREHILKKTALIKIGKGKGTILACIFLTEDFSRAEVNQNLEKINSSNAVSCYKEIEKIELVPIDNILSLDRDNTHKLVYNMPDAAGNKRKITITSFAIAAIHDFHSLGCF